jgi:hypothetical protein
MAAPILTVTDQQFVSELAEKISRLPTIARLGIIRGLIYRSISSCGYEYITTLSGMIDQISGEDSNG